MRVLELFKGTGSLTKYCEANGWECVSLDIEPKFGATHTCDILDFDYTQYPVGHFDIIWASPECKVYSSLQYMNVGKYKYKTRADLQHAQQDNWKYTDKAIEMIHYFNPHKWFIENPLTSQLMKHPKLAMMPFIICDYCRFGTSHKKPTRIWTNVEKPNARCVCVGNHKCVGSLNKHQDLKDVNYLNNKLETKYAIPQLLIEYLMS